MWVHQTAGVLSGRGRGVRGIQNKGVRSRKNGLGLRPMAPSREHLNVLCCCGRPWGRSSLPSRATHYCPLHMSLCVLESRYSPVKDWGQKKLLPTEGGKPFAGVGSRKAMVQRRGGGCREKLKSRANVSRREDGGGHR